MQSFAETLKVYTRDYHLDAGNGDAQTVLDQLYQAYAESHKFDPSDIRGGFRELDILLGNSHWKITMLALTSATTSAPPMSIKHSWTASNMGHI